LPFASPPRPALGHFWVMFCLGILLVEVCLFTFHKIPFTCSYLPGKGSIHFAFWAGVLFFLRFLHEAAELEGRLLREFPSSVLMIVMVALAAVAIRYLGSSREVLTTEVLFEEAYPAEITGLGLN
jgi:hypothetical protein